MGLVSLRVQVSLDATEIVSQLVNDRRTASNLRD